MEQVLAAIAVALVVSSCTQTPEERRFEQFMFKAKYCREYTSTIRVGGKDQETWGQACLLPDGTWEVQR